ncbi:MAG: hypothetical protein R3A50_04750 [Saprospiraceae bacterium]
MVKNPEPGQIPDQFQVKKGVHYLLKGLPDIVVCMHVDQPKNYSPETPIYATFEFFKKIAAFHEVPFTLPSTLWDTYLEETVEKMKVD